MSSDEPDIPSVGDHVEILTDFGTALDGEIKPGEVVSKEGSSKKYARWGGEDGVYIEFERYGTRAKTVTWGEVLIYKAIPPGKLGPLCLELARRLGGASKNLKEHQVQTLKENYAQYCGRK